MLSNFFTENPDIQFHFKHTIDWKKIIPLVENNYTEEEGFANQEEALEFYTEIASNVGRLIGKEMVPRAVAIDKKGCSFSQGTIENPKELDEICGIFQEMGLHSLIQPREFGGLNVPFIIQCVLVEMTSQIDLSCFTNIAFSNAISEFLFMFSLLEGSTKLKEGKIVECRFQKQIEEMVEGKTWGAMVLTEPNAGSDLGNLQTKATRVGDHWVLNGSKLFITEGHGEHHIVLARTEEAKEGSLGLEGLSLFYVPMHRQTEQGERVENFKVGGIEDKIGLKGSPTCSLIYEETYGELIGEQGKGFNQMVRMMNGFRLGVGFQSLGMVQGAIAMAKDYAQVRHTMGKPIMDHELVADLIYDMETDLFGLRALAYETVSDFEIAQREEILLEFNETEKEVPDKEERRKVYKKLKHLVRKRTPLLKYLGSEKAVEFARLNMQIHGGFGYTKEYQAERLLRDALVLPVYEGSSQIQALMTLKDEMKEILKRPSQFLKNYFKSCFYWLPFKSETEKLFLRCDRILLKCLKQLLWGMIREKRRKVQASQGGLFKVLTLQFLKNWDPKTDFAFALLHSERLCRVITKVEIATILKKQATEFPDRQVFLKRYCTKILPEIRLDFENICHGKRDVLDWIESNQKDRESTNAPNS